VGAASGTALAEVLSNARATRREAAPALGDPGFSVRRARAGAPAPHARPRAFLTAGLALATAARSAARGSDGEGIEEASTSFGPG